MPGAAPPMMPGYVVPDRFGLAPPPLIHDSPYVAVKPRGPLMGPKPGEGPPGPDFGDKHPGMFYHVPHKTTGLQVGVLNHMHMKVCMCPKRPTCVWVGVGVIVGVCQCVDEYGGQPDCSCTYCSMALCAQGTKESC
eukprot:scaffold49747_cov21-Tisochrysis_lutea.AAC.1